MPFSVNLFRKLEKVDPAIREVLLALLEEMEKQRTQWEQSVTKTEFNELKEIVAELAEAQKETERRLNELAEAQKQTEQRLNELAEAQRKTEQRVERLERIVAELAVAQRETEKRLNELAEAQKETEKRLNELAEAQRKTEQRLNELAEAQKETERRLNELAEAQKQTEQRLNELAEAQRKTEQEIAKLTKGLNRTRKELGGLSRSVAYALENEAFRYLPSFLEKKHGIKVKDRFIRATIGDREINIFAKVEKNGKEAFLVGEAVLRLDDPAKLRQIHEHVAAVKEELGGEIIPIIVTHFAKPNILERAEKAGILVVQSFEWI